MACEYERAPLLKQTGKRCKNDALEHALSVTADQAGDKLDSICF